MKLTMRSRIKALPLQVFKDRKKELSKRKCRGKYDTKR